MGDKPLCLGYERAVFPAKRPAVITAITGMTIAPAFWPDHAINRIAGP